MNQHTCEFGKPSFRLVGMCSVGDCTEMRIGTKRGGWRTLTATERTAVLAHQMEAVAVAQAMVVIHGQERGMRRAREVLGYPA